MSRASFLVEPEDRRQLVHLTQTGSKRMAARAQIVLLSERGLTVEQIAGELSIVPPTVYKWRRRFAERGIAGLNDLPRPGQPLKLTLQRKQAILRLVTEAVPEDALEWSIRRLAKVAGVTEHQARSVLRSRRVPPLDRTEGTDTGRGRWPAELGVVCLASPIVAAVVVVDTERAATGAPVGPARAEEHTRLARYRNDPRSLYRAFGTSESASPHPAERARQLLTTLGELSVALPPSRALELIVAPAGAFAAPLHAQVQRPVRVVPLPSVSVWLRTVESYLLWLEDLEDVEDQAAAPRAGGSEVQALRACLARHNTQQAPRSGAEFFWKNPRLSAAPP